jgi:flagellar biosynthesis GTPase FlhF
MSTTTAEPLADDAVAAAPPPAAGPELRTYRGRTLEELLPKIRDELGPDAIVVRQRDGLMGGIGGFFQQRFVEIEARRGHARVDVYDEPPAVDFAAQLAAAEEQAAEPLVTAAPFADALPSAAAPASPLLADRAAAPVAAAPPVAAEPAPAAPAAPPLVAAARPEPAAEPGPPAADFASALPVAARPEPESPTTASPPHAEEPRTGPDGWPRGDVAAAPPANATERAGTSPRGPAGASAPDDPERAALIATLVVHGVSDAFARELVADAAAHVLPLASDGSDLRAATAAALARRIPLAPLPAGRGQGRTVAFVGAAGAGKTRCTAALAAAHAHAGQPVHIVALDADDDGAELTRLLAPHGITVQSAGSPSAARAALDDAPAGALVVLDAPAVSPGDAAAIARLATRLARIGIDETHVALPATLSAAAAQEQLERLAPLKPSAIVLTHADATDHVGAIVELACASALPLAYVADGRALPGGLTHADPAAIAERLLR